MYHLIKAVTQATNIYEVIVIGSQSILGSHPNANAKLLISEEADFIPILSPEHLEQHDNQYWLDNIEYFFGKDSRFHKTFGIYADACELVTASLPEGWQDRLVSVQNEGTDLRIASFLDPNDLAISKLVAFREKDVDFLKVMYAEGLIDPIIVKERLDTVNQIDDIRRRDIKLWIDNQEKIKNHKDMNVSGKLLLQEINIPPRDFKEYCSIREKNRAAIKKDPNNKLKGVV